MRVGHTHSHFSHHRIGDGDSRGGPPGKAKGLKLGKGFKGPDRAMAARMGGPGRPGAMFIPPGLQRRDQDTFTPAQAPRVPPAKEQPITAAPGAAAQGVGAPGAAAPGAGAPGVAAPGAATPEKKTAEPPYINQYAPAGADANYLNADQNCGPAIMAMIARQRGLGAGLDDADLITELGKVGATDATGTSGNGMIAMAEQMGLPTAAQPGSDPNWVMSQLAQGKQVVANGDFFALSQHADPNQTSPHYLLLTGIDQNGNILAKDPADANVKVISPADLQRFNQSHPDGGFNIAIG